MKKFAISAVIKLKIHTHFKRAAMYSAKPVLIIA